MLRLLISRHTNQFFGLFNNGCCFQTQQLCRINSLRSFSSTWKKFESSNCDQIESCIDKPTKWPGGKRNGFDFHEEIEVAMNKQINVELKAFYYYLSMAAYFGREDVALPGCESLFTQMHCEEHEHALKFVNYINMRGGKVHLCAVSPPDDQNWKCPLHAFKTALQLEVDVSRKLVAVNAIAEKHGDLNASDFVITNFMEEQMKSVNKFGRFVSVLSGIGDRELARFVFDKDLLENYVMPDFNILKNKSQRNKFDK